jgi:hypothetical protein
LFLTSINVTLYGPWNLGNFSPLHFSFIEFCSDSSGKELSVEPRWLVSTDMPGQDDITKDVDALMKATDEIIWQRAGLYDTTNSLGNGTITLNSPPGDLTTYRSNPHSIKLSHMPTNSGILPGLSDYSRPAVKVSYDNNVPELQRETAPPGTQKREYKPVGPSGSRRRQWKSNKVFWKMVLGSDVGLEEAARMVLCG